MSQIPDSQIRASVQVQTVQMVQSRVIRCNGGVTTTPCSVKSQKQLELELIQTQMAQKPMLLAEVGMRVRCANKASAE